MERSDAKGRYIVAVDPERSGYSYQRIAAVLAESYPSYPIPTVQAPMWLLYVLGYAKIDKKLDIWSVDTAARAANDKIDGRGIAGTRITETLGFQYNHEDLKGSIRDAAASMVHFGIVDGTRVMRRGVKVLAGAVVVLVLGTWYLVQRKLFAFADAPDDAGGASAAGSRVAAKGTKAGKSAKNKAQKME